MEKNNYKKKYLVVTEILKNSSVMFPPDAEAWDMWGIIKNCHERLYRQYGEELGEMNTWDCYQTFCQDCEEHDICFKHSDWFESLFH